MFPTLPMIWEVPTFCQPCSHLLLAVGKAPLMLLFLLTGRSGSWIDFVRKTHIESKGAVRFFSMGIGNAVSHELIEGIANQEAAMLRLFRSQAARAGRNVWLLC
jgi:hypothetical protein